MIGGGRRCLRADDADDGGPASGGGRRAGRATGARWYWVGAGLVALVAAGAPARAQQGAVACYDPDRQIVQQKLAHECSGRVLSPAEAEAMRRRLRRARAERIAPSPDHSGDGPPDRRKTPAKRYGSAFAFGPAGHFITAAHVVTGCTRIDLETAAGDRFAADLLAEAMDMDAALLRSDLQVVPAPSVRDVLSKDRPVKAVGYPEEGLMRLTPRVRTGRIAGHGRLDAYCPLYAVRIAVRGGNSGGPLFTDDGRLAGMVVAKVDRSIVFRRTGEHVPKVGYAVPVQRLASFLARHDLVAPTDSDGPAEAQRVICTPPP